MTSTIVLNHIATLWLNAQHGDTQAASDLYARMIKKAMIMSSVGIGAAYEDRFEYIEGDADRERELAMEYAEAIVECYKVRELAKLEKELEAAERERKEAECRAERKAKVEAQNDAEQTVYAQVENEVERREADARIDYAIKQFGRYTQEACAAIRAIEIKKEHKPFNSAVDIRLAAAWQASAQQSDRSAFCALLARINAPEWLVDFLASGRCWMISPATAARLMIDHCDVEALEAERDVYDAVRAYLWSGDDRVLSMVDDDTASELAAMQRSLMRELYLEEAIALVLNAQKEKENAQDSNVETFPVAVESKEWTDDDFAIDPRDAYVETMKAVAVEDSEEPEDVELDEYIKEYRAAHKETRARRLARSLRDFLWTRGFSLDDVGKAEWWQTVALRWSSLDEFVAVAKAGGLKNIDKYLRRGLRKANKRRAVRALLRIARAYAETCL